MTDKVVDGTQEHAHGHDQKVSGRNDTVRSIQLMVEPDITNTGVTKSISYLSDSAHGYATPPELSPRTQSQLPNTKTPMLKFPKTSGSFSPISAEKLFSSSSNRVTITLPRDLFHAYIVMKVHDFWEKQLEAADRSSYYLAMGVVVFIQYGIFSVIILDTLTNPDYETWPWSDNVGDSTNINFRDVILIIARLSSLLLVTVYLSVELTQTISLFRLRTEVTYFAKVQNAVIGITLYNVVLNIFTLILSILLIAAADSSVEAIKNAVAITFISELDNWVYVYITHSSKLHKLEDVKINGSGLFSFSYKRNKFPNASLQVLKLFSKKFWVNCCFCCFGSCMSVCPRRCICRSDTPAAKRTTSAEFVTMQIVTGGTGDVSRQMSNENDNNEEEKDGSNGNDNGNGNSNNNGKSMSRMSVIHSIVHDLFDDEPDKDGYLNTVRQAFRFLFVILYSVSGLLIVCLGYQYSLVTVIWIGYAMVFVFVVVFLAVPMVLYLVHSSGNKHRKRDFEDNILPDIVDRYAEEMLALFNIVPGGGINGLVSGVTKLESQTDSHDAVRTTISMTESGEIKLDDIESRMVQEAYASLVMNMTFWSLTNRPFEKYVVDLCRKIVNKKYQELVTMSNALKIKNEKPEEGNKKATGSDNNDTHNEHNESVDVIQQDGNKKTGDDYKFHRKNDNNHHQVNQQNQESLND